MRFFWARPEAARQATTAKANKPRQAGRSKGKVAAGALFGAGGASGWLVGGFFVIATVAFSLEDTRWQFSERVALVLILLSIPVFYFDWRVLTPYLEIQ